MTRCDSVFRLPLPLDVRCGGDPGHDGDHHAGWMRWTDDNRDARRTSVPPAATPRPEEQR